MSVCAVFLIQSVTITAMLTLQWNTTQPFYGLLDFVRDDPCEPTPERYHQEGKTNLDLLEQEIESGSGISWAISKSAP